MILQECAFQTICAPKITCVFFCSVQCGKFWIRDENSNVQIIYFMLFQFSFRFKFIGDYYEFCWNIFSRSLSLSLAFSLSLLLLQLLLIHSKLYFFLLLSVYSHEWWNCAQVYNCQMPLVKMNSRPLFMHRKQTNKQTNKTNKNIIIKC